MTTFRRSRFAKFIAGFLILTLSAAIVANIVGTILIMDENLYYATRSQLHQKVYSYIYDYTANDLMRYLNIAEKMYCNNDTYKNYHSSEIELYRSKYLPENSNIYFEIKDEYGNILLKNDNDIHDQVFTFSSVFTTETMYYDEWYEQSDSDTIVTNAYPSTESVSQPYAEPDTTAKNELSTESTTFISEPATTNSIKDDSSTETDISIPVPTNENNELKCESVIIENINSGNNTTLKYYYTGELDEKIFRYCKDAAAFLAYDISDIDFYQDEYYCSEYDEIQRNYTENEPDIPIRTFSTKLISDNKSVNVNYSYKGSFYLNEFENRLSYLSLIIKNLDADALDFNYTQKGRINLLVEVNIPYSCYAKDIYNIAEKFVDIAIVYRDNIIGITVADAIILIASLIFLFWSAGYVPKKQEPVARGLHGIPFDLYVFFSASVSIGCLILIDSRDELWVFLGFIGLTFILLSLIYTLPVRIRTKTLKKNTLIFKCYTMLKNAVSVMNEVTGSRFRIFLILAIFLFISVCETLGFMIFEINGYAVTFIFMLLRLAETPVIVFLLVALLALHNGAKQISTGDVSYRISDKMLIGPLKKHAYYLNSINNAVNHAVEERMKSESLKTELITNVSHDLKTPLTSIVNYVDLLKKTDITDSKALEYIEVIDRQSQRLKKLTFDIVEASKAATGNIEVHNENTVLNVILSQTGGEYVERLQEKSLSLISEVPDNDIVIMTDGRLLWRVIDNLMSNICKYSMPGTRVYISLWTNENKAYISFRNISKNKLNITPDSLTERFVRGDASRNTEGSGLGLSIAKSLTEMLGGKLSIVIDGDLFKVTLSLPLKP